MKKIPVRIGRFALVDEDDLPVLKRFKWRAHVDHLTTYATADIWHDGVCKQISMHRLVMGFPRLEVDHIDGNGLNNTKSNLRLATHLQNARNRKPTGGFGIRGVYMRPSKRWTTYIFDSGRKAYLGTYDTKVEASRVRDAAMAKMHGEFVRLNGI